MTRRRFEAELRPSGRGGGGHLIEVPAEVVSALGGRGRTPVRATFNGVAYRGSIVTMSVGFVLGVTKAVMAEAGVAIGDRLDVVVELDERPRDVELPEDLRAALEGREDLRRAWDGFSFTRRREFAQSIDEARRPETRAKRLKAALEVLVERTRG